MGIRPHSCEESTLTSLLELVMKLALIIFAVFVACFQALPLTDQEEWDLLEKPPSQYDEYEDDPPAHPATHFPEMIEGTAATISAMTVHYSAPQPTGCNYVVDSVSKYSSQVVAGIMYRVEYKIKSGNCRDMYCKAELVEQPWMSDGKTVQTVTCT